MTINGFRVRKLGYSAKPWRIVTDDGKELSGHRQINHPNLGLIRVESSEAFDTKAAAIDALGDYALQLHDALEAIRKDGEA